MKNKTKIIITIAAFILLCCCLNLYELYKEKIRKNAILTGKKMYCYDANPRGHVNPAIFVKDIKLCDSLKQYYQKVEKGNLSASFHFDPFNVPLDTCVYVVAYNNDSTMAKIVFWYEYKNQHHSAEGYVFAHTLHQRKGYNVTR